MVNVKCLTLFKRQPVLAERLPDRKVQPLSHQQQNQ